MGVKQQLSLTTEEPTGECIFIYTASDTIKTVSTRWTEIQGQTPQQATVRGKTPSTGRNLELHSSVPSNGGDAKEAFQVAPFLLR